MEAAWRRWTGPGEDSAWRENLAWFRRLVLMHMAARTYLTLPETGVEPFEVTLRWAMIVVAAAGLWAPLARLATLGAALLVLIDVLIQLPLTANHVFLELVLLAALSLLDERDEREGPLLLSALRWFIAVFFFYTGLQKVLYGYYFRGEFLTYLAGTEERFAAFFQHLMSAEELKRLQSYNEELVDGGSNLRWVPRFGAGPYRVDSTIFVLMSNSVYLFEMAAGALLLSPKFRRFAALAGILFVILIEIGARELTFGVLMTNLLLLFVPGTWIRKIFPLFAVLYAYLVMHHLGWVPMFRYSPA